MLASSDRGSGPPIVLLHGQPGSGESWGAFSRLLETDARVLAPDRVGYGATGGDALGLAGTADVVASFLRGRGAAPATVVAHSWAGGAAVLLAVRHPDTVQSLVLVGAACTPDSLTPLDRWLTIPVLADAMAMVGLAGIAWVLPELRRLGAHAPARYRRRIATALPDRGVVRGGASTLGRDRRTFVTEQRALVDELPTVTDALGRLRVPVAVVTGAWDLVVPPRSAVTLAAAVPGATLTVLPGCGHFVSRDAPEALVEVVRRAADEGRAAGAVS